MKGPAPLSRLEYIIIGIVVGVSVPAACTFIGWGSAVSLYILFSSSGFPEDANTVAAVAGASVGMLMTAIHLRTWIVWFYATAWWWIISSFVFWSAVVMTVFGGMPFGNIVLAMLAGVYAGRRSFFAGLDRVAYVRRARRVGYLAGSITGIMYGAVVLATATDGKFGSGTIARALGLEHGTVSTRTGLLMLLGGWCAAVYASYWCARIGAAYAYGCGKELS